MYDTAFMGVLQSCGKLPTFLDELFSFLARRTDFYVIMPHERAKMGFPPGVAQEMVMQAFKKYEVLTRKREAEIMREEETKRAEAMTQSCTSVCQKSGENARVAGEAERSGTGHEDHGNPVSEDKNERKATSNLASDTYNGAVQENYMWSQTLTDVDVRIPVDPSITAKDVKVDIKNDHLTVVILKPERRVMIDGQLLNRIKVEDSLWNLEKGTGLLQINLEKAKEMMWKSVLVGDKEIDLSKVDNTKSISDFDAEAQAAIQRVTYDHHQKMLGKPTSGQQKAYNVLEKAWNAPGSPFQGTPFDPTKVDVSGDWN